MILNLESFVHVTATKQISLPKIIILLYVLKNHLPSGLLVTWKHESSQQLLRFDIVTGKPGVCYGQFRNDNFGSSNVNTMLLKIVGSPILEVWDWQFLSAGIGQRPRN